MRIKYAIGDFATLRRDLTTFSDQKFTAGELLVVDDVSKIGIALHAVGDENKKINQVLREYLERVGGPNDVRPDKTTRTASLRRANLHTSAPGDWVSLYEASIILGLSLELLRVWCKTAKRKRSKGSDDKKLADGIFARKVRGAWRVSIDEAARQRKHVGPRGSGGGK